MKVSNKDILGNIDGIVSRKRLKTMKSNEILVALRELVEAGHYLKDGGVLDCLSHAPDGGEKWHSAMERAQNLLKTEEQVNAKSSSVHGKLAVFAMKELRKGLKTFGSYDFFDKGPDSIMNIREIANKFRVAGVEKSIQAFREILTDVKYGAKFASAIIGELEDWDELWDKHKDFLSEYY